MMRFSHRMRVLLLYVCHVLTFVVCNELVLQSGTSETVVKPALHKPTEAHTWEPVCPDNCACVKDVPSVTRTFNNNMFKLKHKIVNCSSIGVSSVPMNLPVDTDILFLNGNNISSLENFPYVPNLKYLDLCNNNIQTVDKYIFARMKNLKYVSLRNNTLEQLLHGSFSGLLGLDHLDLSGNKIWNIPVHAFAGLNHLKLLEIQKNRLTDLNPEWFKDMFDINILKLSHNLLTHISDKVFNILHDLNVLELSDNKINKIDDRAFSVLHRLRVLDLSNNMLTRIPTKQLKSCTSVTKVLLDGNQIKRIETGDFSSMNITFLSVSYIDSLILIEKLAFHDLPSLVSLQIHDNRNLIYIDHNAIVGVPKLKRLYVHNNQLTAFSSDILDQIPTLAELHLYNNPLRCDCNALWIKELLESANVTNNTNSVLRNSKSVKCDFPLNVTGNAIQDVDEDIFGRVCAPTTLELLNESYSLDFGEELLLECHAFGVPNTSIHWTFPNGTVIDKKSNNEKVQVIKESVLIVRHLTTLDSGTYSCISDNGIGYDIGSTYLHVIDKPVRIVPSTIASDYVSVSWNGTKHNAMISDYQLRYIQVNNQDVERHNRKIKLVPYNYISIGPQFHSYTVTHLQPKTLYEFCIVYVSDAEYYKVDCVNVTTSRKSNDISVADTDTETDRDVNKVIGVILSTGLVVAIILVCVIVVSRKYRGRRKYYATPYDPDEVEPVNIQMDTIYPSLTVPLYSSRTSLLDEHGQGRDGC